MFRRPPESLLTNTMPDKELSVQSGVNGAGEPFVQLIKDGRPICQMTSEEARSHGRDMVEVAEAAEQDAFLINFFKTKFSIPIEQVGPIMQDYRRWREDRGKKGPPSNPANFVRSKDSVWPK